MKPKKRPGLTPEIVTDEQLLVEAIEALLLPDRNLVRQRRRLIRRQEKLRRVAGGEAWQAYLTVEEEVNARYDLALRLVAAWAFAEGRRCG